MYACIAFTLTLEENKFLEIHSELMLSLWPDAKFISPLCLQITVTAELLSMDLINNELSSFQVSGFSVVADRLNFYRFLSHFRCVHRGSFFSQMRTTSVRKLLPEAWGMLQPSLTFSFSSSVINVVTPNSDITVFVL